MVLADVCPVELAGLAQCLYWPFGGADGGELGGFDVGEDLLEAALALAFRFSFGEEPEWAFLTNLHDTDDDSQGAIELECDEFTNPGWSGGPIFGPIDNTQKVVGVCLDLQSEYVFPFGWEHDSVFAGGSWMVGLIQWGLANWP
jgi:hypothetical protein